MSSAEAVHQATSRLLTISIDLNTISNEFWTLQRFIFSERLVVERSPYIANTDPETSSSKDEDSISVEWSYEAEVREKVCKYADAMFTEIVEELITVGFELSKIAEKVRVLKIGERGAKVDASEVKKLEALFCGVKQLEVGIWRDIAERSQVKE